MIKTKAAFLEGRLLFFK